MSADEIKRPDKVARVSDAVLYDALCMDLEWRWLQAKQDGSVSLPSASACGLLSRGVPLGPSCVSESVVQP